jgi:hypothetical protein
MNRRTVNDMPHEIPELCRGVRALRAAMRDLNTIPAPPQEVVDYQVINTGRIAISHFEISSETDEDGAVEWRRIAQMLARRMEEAKHNVQIDLFVEQRGPIMNNLVTLLKGVEGAIEGLSDARYIRALQTRISQNEATFMDNLAPVQELWAVREFLDTLSTASDFEALPEEFQGGDALRVKSDFQRATRGFEVDDTIIEGPESYPRLAQIYRRVRLWGDDADEAVL